MAIEGHGFPAQTRRYHLTDQGVRLRDERRVADPRSEVSAEVFELMLWQVGALGLLAPAAALQYEPSQWNASAKVRWGGVAWDVEVVHQSEAAPTWVTVTENGAGDVTLTFPATAIAADGTAQPVSLLGAIAQPCGLDGADAPVFTASVDRLSALSFRIRTRAVPSLSLTSTPFVFIAFGG